MSNEYSHINPKERLRRVLLALQCLAIAESRKGSPPDDNPLRSLIVADLDEHVEFLTGEGGPNTKTLLLNQWQMVRLHCCRLPCGENDFRFVLFLVADYWRGSIEKGRQIIAEYGFHTNEMVPRD